MRLYAAARMADTETATDAYGTDTFKCQFEPMSFSKIDGVSVKKRSISVAPTVTLPSRGALTIDGQVYLFGHPAPDYWKGEVIRQTVIVQGADGLANLRTIGEALAGAAPRQAYAAVVFSKYMPEAADNSRYPPQYQTFLAGSELVPADSLIELDGSYFLVKQSYLSTSGLRIALTNIVDEPCFETITFGSRTYDPLTDSWSSAGSPVNVFRVKWSESFTYLSKSSETCERGDIMVFMLKTHTPKPSDLLALSDGPWRVLAVADEGATWRCHVRRS